MHLQPITNTAPVAAPRTWSPYQEAVFSVLVNGKGNVAIEAVAGSGKTTTIVEGLRRWQNAGNLNKRALFCAFNKNIADELSRKVPPGVDARTLHSLCFSAVRRRFKNIKVSDDKQRDAARAVVEAAFGTQDMERVNAAVADLMKTYGLMRGTMTDLADSAAVAETVGAYGAQLDAPADSLPLLNELDQVMKSQVDSCTFDEMLTFAVDHSVPLPKYDLICVDESQDLNRLQIELLKRALAPNGRLVAVGDSRQAIYLFRGADARAMERIREEFSVSQGNCLPLSITYRCPRAVVALAQTWVEHIQASDNAAEGQVIEKKSKDFSTTMLGLQPGAMVVCRVNAPLVTGALRLIASGKKAIVRGRDIGKTVAKLATKLARGLKDDEIVELVERISDFGSTEALKFIRANKQAQAQQIEDQCETLFALTRGLNSIAALHSRINTLFSDDQVGVVFSSAHKAKGLEAETVVWMGPSKNDQMEDRARNDAARQVESNIRYVIVTRAIKTLIVQPLPEKDSEE